MSKSAGDGALLAGCKGATARRNKPDPLLEDVARFLFERGGVWEGLPSKLHSEVKPPTPEALTRKLNALSKRYERDIAFESGKRWNPETENSERHVKISLRDRVNGVNGDKDGGAA
jgi:hypothetical protein